MTSTTGNNGRLGNQIIRNLAVSLLAEKHNLKVNYHNEHLIKQLGIELFSGINSHDHIQSLTDDNYFAVYNGELNCNLNPNKNYFQTKEIINFLHNHLNQDKIRTKIVDNNPFKDRYANNNDLFVHVRLTDVAHFNPGMKYYVNAIKNVKFDNLYISTDDKTHHIITQICKLYPCAKLIRSDEITTIQFASTCKHIILSHGSFSAVIGYLSFFSNVYYPEYELNKMWYGDMFSIENWTKLSSK